MGKSKIKNAPSPISFKEPARVSIEKAKNGYVINKGYGEGTHIAKTMKEAVKIQEKLLK